MNELTTLGFRDTEIAVIAALLIGAGAVLQAYGFWLARNDSRRFEKALNRYVGTVIARPGPARLFANAWDASVLTSDSRTVEDRVGNLEAGLKALAGSVAELRATTTKEAQELADKAESEAKRVTEEEIVRLAEVVKEIPGQGDRPIWFFVGGLVLETIGTLLGLTPLVANL